MDDKSNQTETSIELPSSAPRVTVDVPPHVADISPPVAVPEVPLPVVEDEFTPVEKTCLEQLEITLEHMDTTDKENTLVSCIRLMAIAETFGTIPGVRRKELVMIVIKKHATGGPGGYHHGGLTGFMDIVIDIEKGKLAVSIPTNDTNGCLSALLSRCLPSKK